MDGEVYHAMFANLFEHVVEESQTGMNVAASIAVQIEFDIDIRLFCRALHLGSTFTAKGYLCHLVPVADLQELTTDVLSKLTVGVTVANYV